MEMQVRRRWAEGDATIGELAFSINGERWCYTLEDVVRGTSENIAAVKIPNRTAIPAGRYQVVMAFSPHFQRELPHLVAVPSFTYVMLHGGNVAADTDGCILCGMAKGAGRISNCAPAVDGIIEQVVLAKAIGQCWVTVEDIS